jgi:hypothetical protein
MPDGQRLPPGLSAGRSQTSTASQCIATELVYLTRALKGA